MVSPELRDVVDLVTGIGTLIGFASFGFGWLYTRRESKQKAEQAIEQINKMSENHFPHMESDIRLLKEETIKSNSILSDLKLGQVETNAILRTVVKL